MYDRNGERACRWLDRYCIAVALTALVAAAIIGGVTNWFDDREEARREAAYYGDVYGDEAWQVQGKITLEEVR